MSGPHAIPAGIDACRRRIAVLEAELAIIERQHANGIDPGEREGHAARELARRQEHARALARHVLGLCAAAAHPG